MKRKWKISRRVRNELILFIILLTLLIVLFAIPESAAVGWLRVADFAGLFALLVFIVKRKD